jgi:hypothetical protein
MISQLHAQRIKKRPTDEKNFVKKACHSRGTFFHFMHKALHGKNSFRITPPFIRWSSFISWELWNDQLISKKLLG